MRSLVIAIGLASFIGCSGARTTPTTPKKQSTQETTPTAESASAVPNRSGSQAPSGAMPIPSGYYQPDTGGRPDLLDQTTAPAWPHKTKGNPPAFP
ncbi:MAG: hypothetical protein NT069_03335 [Planctomycetota bacterium]|nr:hypothetical protein [Planctomycetota bacterium]